MRRNTIQDVFQRIQITPSCWWWTGSFWLDKMGYGRVAWQGESRMAHHVLYEHYKGRIPAGLIVRHRCDNPKCVNPEHLELGTHQDNSDDCVARNRQATGEGHGRALVTVEEVKQIRDLLKCGLFSQATIGKFYGVKRSLVSDIKGNRCWGNHG